MSCSYALVTVVFTGKAFSIMLLELAVSDSVKFFPSIYWMWLSQTDKLIAPVGLVILASCTILVACSGIKNTKEIKSFKRILFNSK